MHGPTQLDALKTSIDLQSEFVRDLSMDSDLDRIMDRIVRKTSEIVSATACSVFTVDPDGERATQRAGSGYQEQFNGKRDIPVVSASRVFDLPEPGHELGLTGWILSTGKPFLARGPEEVIEHPHYSGRFNEIQLPGQDVRLRSFLGVPIRGVYGEVVGVLKAERLLVPSEPVESFSIEDELALETIARVASRAITYFGMARDRREAEAVTAWARDVIAEALATESELDSFLDVVVRVVAAAMRADSCGIFLRDEGGKTLTQRAGIGSQALRRVIRSYPWPDRELICQCLDVRVCDPPCCSQRTQAGPPAVKVGLTSWIAATGRPFHAGNFTELSAHCHHRGRYDDVNFESGKECGAFLGVPLQIGGTILGVMKVENTSEKGTVDDRDFSGDSWRRFEILAQDVSLAAMRLQSQIPARSRIIRKAEETILEISRGGLEIPELVSKVVKETRALFDAGACALFLRDGDRLVQHPWAADGWAKSGPEVRTYNLVSLDAIKENPNKHEKVGLTVWIAVTQRKFTARSNQELRMHPHHLGTYDTHNFKEGEGCHSFMGLPLLIKEDGGHELVGVLKVESKKKRVGDVEDQTYFNELDELAFELIANSAAIAIQNARLAGAKARERAWQEFSGMTAHRIGTEAVNIRGALRRLREALSAVPTTEYVSQNLTRLAESLKRLDGWVYEFGEFAHAPELKLEWLNLNELCHKVESQFAAEGAEKVQVTLELAPGLPSLWGDREMLLYVFKELFQNALKAMPEGGQLTVTTEFDGGLAHVHFKDTGKGIDAAIKPRIFEAGFRARPGGTGLGLAIVQRTIHEHRGTIREVSGPGSGAHFVIELSVAELDHAASQHEPRTILLVEDNPLVREDLEQIIGKDAPNRLVVPVANEAAAIRLLDERSFDVVVTDVALDEGGGTATGGLDIVRAAHGKAPVIVVTAYSRRLITVDGRSTTVAEEAKRLGCFALIPRPHPVKDYEEVLREAVTEALRAKAGAVSVSM